MCAKINFLGSDVPRPTDHPGLSMRIAMEKRIMVTWLVTGVSSGLGRALAEAALARGDTVCGTARSDADLADFAALAPGRSLAFRLDVTDRAAIDAVVAAAESASGGIDRLVNNAGYGVAGAIEETTLAQMRALFDVNLFGAIAMIQAVLPTMRARERGRIVNITSVSGLAPWCGSGVYGATKYALECIGQTLAQEVGPLGIAVTNVAPGSFRTKFGGAGLIRADGWIDDYERSGAHEAYRSLSADDGRQRGDPAKAARAILTATDAATPPLHLLLGDDALHYAEDAMAALAGDIAAWRAVSVDCAIDDG